ncbi:four-carbon acid sugar kinase family protein [Paenarthrobacter sp. RAF54_2]|uniref:four-carbon acid sugar kinase family protein n=1 Tax=Paenarthrobacter sp. RAF54_2 TaxID=3233061 RepID=UPI003F9C9492
MRPRTSPSSPRPDAHTHSDLDSIERWDSSSRPKLGVIADGAAEGANVAAVFHRRGLRTLLFFGTPSGSEPLPPHDALVIALRTRGIPAIEAVDLALSAGHWLRQNAVDHTNLHIPSPNGTAANGNLGPMLDALASTLDARSIIATSNCPPFDCTQRDDQAAVDASDSRGKPLCLLPQLRRGSEECPGERCQARPRSSGMDSSAEAPYKSGGCMTLRRPGHAT